MESDFVVDWRSRCTHQPHASQDGAPNVQNQKAARTTSACLALCGLAMSGGVLGAEFMMEGPISTFEREIVGPTSRDADPKYWPSTFVFVSADGFECTATAIGDRAILTAAHCVEKTDHGSLQIGETRLAVVCDKHTNYPASAWTDFSLCLTDSFMKAPPLGFEVVNTDPTSTPPGTNLKLVGFGCRTEGGMDRGFGRLAEGDAVVLLAQPDYLETGVGSAICLGDSGGGAYLSVAAVPSQRRLIGVNSHGDLSDRSYLSVTANDRFLIWAREWSMRHGADICGLVPGMKNCRL